MRKCCIRAGGAKGLLRGEIREATRREWLQTHPTPRHPRSAWTEISEWVWLLCRGQRRFLLVGHFIQRWNNPRCKISHSPLAHRPLSRVGKAVELGSVLQEGRRDTWTRTYIPGQFLGRAWRGVAERGP